MSITWSDVTNAFPGDTALAALPIAAQTTILDQVNNEEINDTTWRVAAKANRARRYLAAHLGVLAAAVFSGSRGPVQSESVGSVSRTYAVSVALGSNNLDGTAYGKEYRRLVRLNFGGPWT